MSKAGKQIIEGLQDFVEDVEHPNPKDIWVKEIRIANKKTWVSVHKLTKEEVEALPLEVKNIVYSGKEKYYKKKTYTIHMKYLPY